MGKPGDHARVVAPAPGTLRRAMADAYHARWCGPYTADCGPDCEGRIDRGSLDALAAAVKAWERGDL